MAFDDYAPAALTNAMRRAASGIGGGVASGVRGDDAPGHNQGYHRGRSSNPPGNYSVTLPLDREGDPRACSAIDVSYPPEQMRAVTRRLMDACQSGDARVGALREFFGTLDGSTVTGWDRARGGHTSSDSSHTWHVHLSIYRKYATDEAAVAGIVDVMVGEGSSLPGDALNQEDDFMAALSDAQQIEMYDRTTKVWEMIATGLVNTDAQFRQMYDRVNYGFEQATPAVLGALQKITQMVASIDAGDGASAEDIVARLGEAITKGAAA